VILLVFERLLRKEWWAWCLSKLKVPVDGLGNQRGAERSASLSEGASGRYGIPRIGGRGGRIMIV
jgi:hypothetical protein